MSEFVVNFAAINDRDIFPLFTFNYRQRSTSVLITDSITVRGTLGHRFSGTPRALRNTPSWYIRKLVAFARLGRINKLGYFSNHALARSAHAVMTRSSVRCNGVRANVPLGNPPSEPSADRGRATVGETDATLFEAS